MSARRFRVHPESQREAQRAGLACPAVVPWSLLAPHEAQAQHNHGQTLERLNERGGLGVEEMVAIINGRGIGDVLRMKLAPSLEALSAHLQRWHDAMQEAERCLTCGHWGDFETHDRSAARMR